jgi:hypothetical protein
MSRTLQVVVGEDVPPPPIGRLLLLSALDLVHETGPAPEIGAEGVEHLAVLAGAVEREPGGDKRNRHEGDLL